VCKRALILPSCGFGLRDWVEDTAREKELTVNVSFEIDSVATTRDLVEGGLGWTILPYAAVQQAVQSDRLFASQIVRPKVQRTLHFAYAASHMENNASRAVRKIINQVIDRSIGASDGRLRAP
jgi:LysR family nitrogen assimilation transcriptional regulator